jgi:hypothetical protein
MNRPTARCFFGWNISSGAKKQSGKAGDSAGLVTYSQLAAELAERTIFYSSLIIAVDS